MLNLEYKHYKKIEFRWKATTIEDKAILDIYSQQIMTDPTWRQDRSYSFNYYPGYNNSPSLFEFSYNFKSVVAFNLLNSLIFKIRPLASNQDQYILDYWLYEMKMLFERRCIRSGCFLESLTSSDSLYQVLEQNRFKGYPPKEALFNFFEKKYSSPAESMSVCEFLEAEQRKKIFMSESLVKKSARIIFQGYEQKPMRVTKCLFFSKKVGSPFYLLPKKINITIASLIGDPAVHTVEETEKISQQYFSRPLK